MTSPVIKTVFLHLLQFLFCNFGSVAASCGSRVTRMLAPQRVLGESLFGMPQKGSASDFEAIAWSVLEVHQGYAYGPAFGGINAVVVFETVVLCVSDAGLNDVQE